MLRPAVLDEGKHLMKNLPRSFCFFISITLGMANLPHLGAQEVTTQAPPPDSVQDGVPDAPGVARYPDAEPIMVKDEGKPVTIESDEPQTKLGGHVEANGNVLITYKDSRRCEPQCTLQADHIEYDDDTGDVTMTGHVVATGGTNDELIHATHGTMNIKTDTGEFFDVSGSVEMKSAAAPKPAATGVARGTRSLYANSNPFLFTGKRVVKTGPRDV